MVQFDLFDTQSTDVLSASTYEEFKKSLQAFNCQKCPELCAGRRHIVVDRGNPRAPLMLIGEGPGENEDKEGKAFVGRAGQLLDKIMESIGLNTNSDMLIVNVVKCRPPENRAPKPQEADNCFPYLQRQFELVKPKVVVLLGATAARHFMKGQKSSNMKDRVGQMFDLEAYPGMTFQLLYHPAFLLRDPRKKKDMWEHVQKLRAHLLENNLIYNGSKTGHESVNR